MKLMPGPDFPTGGIITGRSGIADAYRTGKGKVKIRARTVFENEETNNPSIIITEMPYQVNKARLIEKIADLESEKDMLFTEHTALAKEVVQLNKMIKTRSSNLEKGKRELEKIKTVEQLQKTTASINKNFASTKSSGNRVADSLARAKKKQQEWKDNQKAGDWMEEEESSSDLDKKLSEEGIGGKKTSANDIMHRTTVRIISVPVKRIASDRRHRTHVWQI